LAEMLAKRGAKDERASFYGKIAKRVAEGGGRRRLEEIVQDAFAMRQYSNAARVRGEELASHAEEVGKVLSLAQARQKERRRKNLVRRKSYVTGE
jgi:hypothetical protein